MFRAMDSKKYSNEYEQTLICTASMIQLYSIGDGKIQINQQKRQQCTYLIPFPCPLVPIYSTAENQIKTSSKHLVAQHKNLNRL